MTVYLDNSKVSQGKQQEERRIRWTTFQNLQMWFGNWRSSLEELGFGYKEKKDFIIPQEQMMRILNLDKTSISFDGSNGQTGGHPVATFINARLSYVGEPASKSSNSLTLVAGSTAFGEALQPHF